MWNVATFVFTGFQRYPAYCFLIRAIDKSYGCYSHWRLKVTGLVVQGYDLACQQSLVICILSYYILNLVQGCRVE